MNCSLRAIWMRTRSVKAAAGRSDLFAHNELDKSIVERVIAFVPCELD